LIEAHQDQLQQTPAQKNMDDRLPVDANNGWGSPNRSQGIGKGISNADFAGGMK